MLSEVVEYISISNSFNANVRHPSVFPHGSRCLRLTSFCCHRSWNKSCPILGAPPASLRVCHGKVQHKEGDGNRSHVLDPIKNLLFWKNTVNSWPSLGMIYDWAYHFVNSEPTRSWTNTIKTTPLFGWDGHAVIINGIH